MEEYQKSRFTPDMKNPVNGEPWYILSLRDIKKLFHFMFSYPEFFGTSRLGAVPGEELIWYLTKLIEF